MKTSLISHLPFEIAIVEICSLRAFGQGNDLSNALQKKQQDTKRVGVDLGEVISSSSVHVASTPVSAPKIEVALRGTLPTDPIEGASGTGESTPTSDLTVSNITTMWYKLVALLNEEYHSLSLILQVARPLELKNNTLVLGFQFKLHKDRVNDVSNRRVV